MLGRSYSIASEVLIQCFWSGERKNVEHLDNTCLGSSVQLVRKWSRSTPSTLGQWLLYIVTYWEQCNPVRGQKKKRKEEIHSWAIRETKHGTPPAVRYLQSLAESRIKCLILWSICRIMQTETAANSLQLSHLSCRLLPNASTIGGRQTGWKQSDHCKNIIWKAVIVPGAWSVQHVSLPQQHVYRIAGGPAIWSSHFFPWVW